MTWVSRRARAVASVWIGLMGGTGMLVWRLELGESTEVAKNYPG